MPSPGSIHFPHWLQQFAPAVFLAILFLQSGLDKVLDWEGNLSYHAGHFAKTRLKSTVPLMLGTLTLLELATGALSAIGAIQLLVTGNTAFAFWGATLSLITFLALFFGQRISKDYAGAAGLAPYFLVGLWTAVFTGNVR